MTVTLSADPERTVEVRITATNQGGATSADYSGVPTSVTFDAGDTSQPITFAATQDAEDDDGESVKLAFGALPTGVTAGATAETTVSITDNDDPQVTVSFGAATYTAAEGSTATVTVTLSADPERTVEVPITATNQGGAVAADYSGVPATVTFNSSQTSKTITFAATQDTEDDDGESVRLAFGTSLPAGVSAGATAATTVSITDDDDPQVTVSFGASTYTAAEGGTATVTVTLSADPERTVEVPITATNQGGATSADYSGVPTSVTFDAGDTSQPITFAATQDAEDDDGESVELAFGALPTGVTAGATAETTVSITDNDDPQVTVSFGAATYTAAEGSTATVTVTLSADPERTVEVPITATNQGGAVAADYSGVPATVTFNSSQTSKTITFAATQDTEDDDGESVRLAFGTSLPAGVSAGATAATTVSITDNDDPQVTVSFGASTYTAAEGGTATVTVTLSADPERTVEVPITTTNQGGATSADYSGVPTSVTFDAGDTSQPITFSATQDTLDDDGESVELAFGALPTGVTAGSPSETTVSIRDDDDPAVTVSFGAATYTAAEGSTATVTVTLSADPERTVEVPITATNQGGATSADYSGVPTSVTFDAGDTSQPITFAATQDAEDDDGESVLLGFGTLPGGITATTGEAAETTVSITDDDDPQVTVSFGAATYTAAEGGTATVTVTLSADPERTVEVPITKTEQGGASASDYSGVPATVTFDAGDTSKTFDFAATADTADDDGESVKLGFGSSLPTGVTAGATDETTVSIRDDDDPQVTVSFGAATYRAIEGSTAAVTVELSADPERTVEVPITKTNERGASDSDYSGVPASITFNSGDTEKTITFTAVQDSLNESGERVKLSFGTLPAGVSDGTPDETTVSISDSVQGQRTLPTVHFGAATYTVAEGGGVDVTVTLSKAPGSEAVIPLTASNQGGATASDYSGVPTSVTFGAAETSRTFTVTAAQDTEDDDGESVLLAFGALPTGVTAGATAETTVSITDDDDPGVTVSFGAATYTAAEGSTATVTVTLSADPERTVAIPLTKTNQGGATSADYSGVPVTVTFDAGETSQPITFAATQDTEDDDGESVLLAFGALPTGVTAGATAETTVSITDDDDPGVTVTFGASTYTAAEGSTATVTVNLSADPERTVAIPLTKTNQGGATSADYSGVPATVTFNSGDTSKTFDFTATADAVDDDGESVRLGFGTLPARVSAGSPKETTVSITDDDDPGVTVSFGAATYTAAEGSTATVTVTLSADPERTVAIPLTKTNQGGATSADYSGVPVTVTFDAGETSQPITFAATQDTEDDDGESVLLAFGALPTGVTAGATAETTVSITDDDDPGVTVTFGASTYTAAEGSTATVTVNLSADPERTVAIPLTKTNQGGATSADYSGVPATVTFNSGDTSKTFDFTATADAVDDDGESVRLGFGTSLPAGVSAGSPSETTVSITDDDDPAVTVSFGAATYTAAEGGTATVTVTLSADPERTVAIPVTKTNQGGATSADYSGVPATVTFNSGQTSKTITFTATQDTEDDDGESVELGFGTSLPAGVSAGSPSETTVSITDDDDPAVTVSFGASTYTAAEGGTATVTVTLSADPERTVVIPVTKTNQGGTSAADYSGVPATVTFNTGQISKTFDFAATSDNVDDDGESVRLGFGPLPTGVSAGTTAATVVSITDDDDPGTDEDTPEAGNLRLVDGDLIDDKGQPCERRLEIFYNGAWGTICDDYWTRADGNVACRALGFVAAVEDMDRYRTAYFPPGTQDQQIVLDDLLCKGNESGLLECPSNHPEPGIHNCLHSEDVGLRCLKAGEVAPWIIDVEFGDPPGGNGTYDAGETLDVTLVWSEAVTVTTPSGGLPPKVWLSLWADHGSDHTEMTTGVAEYASGSGTDRTVFRHTLQSGSFSLVGVDYNTLRVRDGSIVSVEGGLDAELDHSSYSSGQTQTQNQAEATTIIGVPAFNDPGADNAWGLGEPVEVTFTFSRPVQVDATGGNPSLPVLLSGRRCTCAAAGPASSCSATRSSTRTARIPPSWSSPTPWP